LCPAHSNLRYLPSFLHDALPISGSLPGGPAAGESTRSGDLRIGPSRREHDAVDGDLVRPRQCTRQVNLATCKADQLTCELDRLRSEEHTSELQSRENLVCRLLLE